MINEETLKLRNRHVVLICKSPNSQNLFKQLPIGYSFALMEEIGTMSLMNNQSTPPPDGSENFQALQSRSEFCRAESHRARRVAAPATVKHSQAPGACSDLETLAGWVPVSHEPRAATYRQQKKKLNLSAV
ncbi:hypothetical protein CEXT_48741 [Caerostris extrusa]|uniref:Uncharacterized protein n=1 Tax=Caerostris extrusa TaxID=172846 RepID=A0AAV4S6V6_CAEEX|nr:hypothetical protein CEXT_48741 [Caerostris extrusa]